MQCAAKLDNAVRLGSLDEIDPVKTFECGQCFRWNAGENGVYTGVAFGRAARVWAEGSDVYISGNTDDYINIWYDYFDLARDYTALINAAALDAYTKKAADFGAGIRILRQDRWEALCSFIISQCNNIPRIKKIIETLCRLYGDELFFYGNKYYSFPSADRLASLEIADLEPLKCGYRAEYIINAAKAVSSGVIDLDKLAEAGYKEALAELMTLTGVGKKVGDCAVLYGLHIQDAFPIDVWMKRALDRHYPKDFDPAVFGKAAGLIQQYIFYYIRSSDSKMKINRNCNRKV
jgi:N-glycosylase/DNA lyase